MKSSALRRAIAGASAATAVLFAAAALPSSALAVGATHAPAGAARQGVLRGPGQSVLIPAGKIRFMGAMQTYYCWLDTKPNGRYVGYEGTSGTQIPTNANCIGTFVRLDGIHFDGTEFYEYDSVQTNLCAKLDPNVGGQPVVSYECDLGDTTATQDEEHWGDPGPQGQMISFYNYSLYLCEVPLSKMEVCGGSEPFELIPS